MVNLTELKELGSQLDELSDRFASDTKVRALLQASICAINHLSLKLIEAEMENKNLKHQVAKDFEEKLMSPSGKDVMPGD